MYNTRLVDSSFKKHYNDHVQMRYIVPLQFFFKSSTIYHLYIVLYFENYPRKYYKTLDIIK